MPTDYEKIYQEQRHALGVPTNAFVTFFEQYQQNNADVLDLGCGQGRDALFIARRGHHVVGVDIAQTGIAQLLEDAQREKLNVEGIVANLTEYEPSGDYDVIVIDRTLHMLDAATRLHILARVCRHVRANGFVLIADEKRNLPDMAAFFAQDKYAWTTVKRTNSLLFVQKTSDSVNAAPSS